MNVKRKAVFERDEYACRYCGGEAEVVDHIIPWSFRHDDSEENLAASCVLCNAWAHNKMFPNFHKKREYLLKKRFGPEKKTPIAVWLQSEINQLGPGLRKKVQHKVIIVENARDASKITQRLIVAGYRVRS